MILCIDIGATFIKYGYYDKEGNCFLKDKMPTIKEKDLLYKSLLELNRNDIEMACLSMPGIINEEGYIEAITLLPSLTHHNIREELEDLFNVNVYVLNDAKCATLGELWKGSLKNIDRGMFIVLGSGIGGALILDGQLLDSPRNKIGEIGSLLLPEGDGYTNFGKHNNSNKLIHDMKVELNIENVFEHAKESRVFAKYCEEMAIMIYNLDYILDLDVVCIGGGISEQKILIDTINEQFHKIRDNYKEDEHQPSIVSCALGNDSNLLGALYFGLSCQNR